jgi:hypothetical protein
MSIGNGLHDFHERLVTVSPKVIAHLVKSACSLGPRKCSSIRGWLGSTSALCFFARSFTNLERSSRSASGCIMAAIRNSVSIPSRILQPADPGVHAAERPAPDDAALNGGDPDGPVLGGPVLGGPVLGDPVLGDPVLSDPVLGDPVLGDPVLGGPAPDGPAPNDCASSGSSLDPLSGSGGPVQRKGPG